MFGLLANCEDIRDLVVVLLFVEFECVHKYVILILKLGHV